ncbi:MAG: tetratricopeptide repeat protein [Pyrinomonadaceae bacterium]
MKNTILAFVLAVVSSQTVFAQNATENADKNNLSETLSKNLEQTRQITDVSAEKREQAYAKLLEGQRHIWNMQRSFRSPASLANISRLARLALQKAIELNPTFDEAYNALAEVAWLTWTASPNDTDLNEAEVLANTAVKINRNNYGGHHRLARIYTIKSGIREDNLDKANAEKAIMEWKEIARLDPRNAEAYAFLSAFYEKTNSRDEQIESLKRWLASSNPINPEFYTIIMGRGERLSPDSASVKLGKVLLDAGRDAEAIVYLNRAISDNPDNEDALSLLREALESADEKDSSTSIQAIEQAAFANPDNGSLISLLAEIYARNGKTDKAAKVLRDSIARFSAKDKVSAANLQIALGDIYAGADRFEEAVSEYRKAIATRGIEDSLVTDSERGFASLAFEKIIQTYKNANRPDEAKNKIEEARTLFGKDDVFADKKLIELYRETGKKLEALQTVRNLRARFADDYSLLRLEAEVLTANGNVDEAIDLIKPLINKKKPVILSPQYDDFSNYIFISMLYMEANRGKDAVSAANQAYSAAKTADQKQYAKLSLANAQQTSGDFKSAEETLRALLKQTPGNPIALNNLGYFLLERNERFEEAIDLIRQALKIDPNNPSYLDSLGWAYFKLGKYTEAEKYLKNASRLAPLSPTILEHLGDVYQKQNKNELAGIALQKALNLSSEKEMTERIKSKLNK